MHGRAVLTPSKTNKTLTLLDPNQSQSPVSVTPAPKEQVAPAPASKARQALASPPAPSITKDTAAVAGKVVVETSKINISSTVSKVRIRQKRGVSVEASK